MRMSASWIHFGSGCLVSCFSTFRAYCPHPSHFFKPPTFLSILLLPLNLMAETTGPRSRGCNCSNKGRNLVICIDGTSNQFGKNVRSPRVPENAGQLAPDSFFLLEYECNRALQPPHQGRSTTHVLQQWRWDLHK